MFLLSSGCLTVFVSGFSSSSQLSLCIQWILIAPMRSGFSKGTKQPMSLRDRSKGVRFNLNRWERLDEPDWPHRWHHHHLMRCQSAAGLAFTQSLLGKGGDMEKVRLPWVTPGWCHLQPDLQLCSIHHLPDWNMVGPKTRLVMCFMISSRFAHLLIGNLFIYFFANNGNMFWCGCEIQSDGLSIWNYENEDRK